MSKYREQVTKLLETVLQVAESQKEVDIDALVDAGAEQMHQLVVAMSKDKLEEMDLVDMDEMMDMDDEGECGAMEDEVEIEGEHAAKTIPEEDDMGGAEPSPDDVNDLEQALAQLNLGDVGESDDEDFMDDDDFMAGDDEGDDEGDDFGDEEGDDEDFGDEGDDEDLDDEGDDEGDDEDAMDFEGGDDIEDDTDGEGGEEGDDEDLEDDDFDDIED